nr:hypothetical protein [Tanacetum cinerariifolium]
APQVGVTVVTSPARLLDLITYSSTDSDSSADLPTPEHASSAPTIPYFYIFLILLRLSEILLTRSRVALLSSSEASSPLLSTHALPFTIIVPPVPCWIIHAPPGASSPSLSTHALPFPFGRPYHTQPNRVVRIMTVRKRVHPFPTRTPTAHRVFYSSSSLPRKRRRTSSHPVTTHSPSLSYGPSHKRCRSPATLVTSATPTPGALSSARVDLLSSRNKIKGSSVALSLEDNIVAEVAIDDEIRAETEDGFEGDDEAEAESSARGT